MLRLSKGPLEAWRVFFFSLDSSRTLRPRSFATSSKGPAEEARRRGLLVVDGLTAKSLSEILTVSPRNVSRGEPPVKLLEARRIFCFARGVCGSGDISIDATREGDSQLPGESSYSLGLFVGVLPLSRDDTFTFSLGVLGVTGAWRTGSERVLGMADDDCLGLPETPKYAFAPASSPPLLGFEVGESGIFSDNLLLVMEHLSIYREKVQARMKDDDLVSWLCGPQSHCSFYCVSMDCWNKDREGIW